MSGSKIVAAKTGVLEILNNALRPSDSIAVYDFNDSVHLRVPQTKKKHMVSAKILCNTQAEGSTRLYDAILHGMKVMGSNPNTHQELIVLTDGEDTGSIASFGELKAALLQPGIPHFHLILVTVGIAGHHLEMLQKLCKPIGPAHCTLYSCEDGPDAISRIFGKLTCTMQKRITRITKSVTVTSSASVASSTPVSAFAASSKPVPALASSRMDSRKAFAPAKSRFLRSSHVADFD
eukprot:Phypoly_transcript_06390.p1 GENE.Phypoly_transcript_06390~~Phypoly_transcript_06390.p1  ORF type:complete len:235 (+),score=20.36 Phypoly_transcript_06390:698-1402(+)